MDALTEVLPRQDADAEAILAEGARPDLRQLQLAAANDRFLQQRPAIPALDFRAEELGVDRIADESTLVSLLFAHSSYKSYPEDLLAVGDWKGMARWLSTISTSSADDLVVNAADVDDWMDQLDAIGFHLGASSGTSGKFSFLPINDDELQWIFDIKLKFEGFPNVLPVAHDRPFIALGPSRGPSLFRFVYQQMGKAFARPGGLHSISDERVRAADSLRVNALRRAMADGTATPSQIAALEAENSARAAKMERAMDEITDLILSYRDEPQFIRGFTVALWEVMSIARRKGIADGTFHPETMISIVGGTKGTRLPDDFAQRMNEFFGDARWSRCYGMSELSLSMMMCEAGLFHCPPWVMLFILDESGENVVPLDAAGRAEGRVGFFDGAWQSRWGGVVTGDRAAARFIDKCECGRPGPVVEDSITRYSELSAGGDDKLTCGGSIDQYIRGVVS